MRANWGHSIAIMEYDLQSKQTTAVAVWCSKGWSGVMGAKKTFVVGSEHT